MRPIDADALLKHRRNFGKDYALDPVDKNIDDQLVDLRHVLNAPTLDYAPVRHGEWILRAVTPRTTIIDEAVTCRSCGSLFHRITGTWFKHCPECGAKMDGGKKDV